MPLPLTHAAPGPAMPAQAPSWDSEDAHDPLTCDETLKLLGAWQDLAPAHRRIFLDLIRTTARLRFATDRRDDMGRIEP
ncbi:hypothetical protein [Roseospira visakhapatnamensis]|uniref:Uncharacterized protein n=1 Tax=Roseospira visakhapatnamensis TaxID=390880 RepID=A0A7W6WC42_9PROT|nr:hypothetical protein [Roseospira visakhapatnamensis]MBB4268191.1 hypothetical protein [Roseospira visakhapatnamensis]